MADILGFPYSGRPGDAYPSDVEPPCESLPHTPETILSAIPDPVRRPPHYVQGNVEVIDIIEHVVAGYPTHLAYHIGSILKYLCRAPYKHSTVAEDLRKAQWYLNRVVAKL